MRVEYQSRLLAYCQQGVATRNPVEIHMEELLYWTGGAGRPWSRTRSYDVEPRPASAEGTLPDVRGRLAGSYRHCAQGMLPIPVDFRHGRGAD